MLPFDKILSCMKFICSDYCIYASRKVIEKRSTDFNLLEDNRTLFKKPCVEWLFTSEKNIKNLQTQRIKEINCKKHLYRMEIHSAPTFSVGKYKLLTVLEFYIKKSPSD